MQTAGASLVAAVPAGILATLLVMMFLRHSENLPTMLQAVTGGTLLFAAVVALTPFGVLLFGGKKKAPSVAAGKGAAVAADADADEDEAEVIASDELDADDDFAQTTDFVSDSELEADDGETAEIEDDDLFADEEDEEPAPKKKKK